MVRDTTDCSLQSSRLHSLSSAQLGSTELYPDGLRLGKLMTKPVCRLYQSLVLSHQNTSSTIQQHPPPTVPTPVLGSGHLRPRRRPVTSVRRQRRSPAPVPSTATQPDDGPVDSDAARGRHNRRGGGGGRSARCAAARSEDARSGRYVTRR